MKKSKLLLTLSVLLAVPALVACGSDKDTGPWDGNQAGEYSLTDVLTKSNAQSILEGQNVKVAGTVTYRDANSFYLQKNDEAIYVSSLATGQTMPALNSYITLKGYVFTTNSGWTTLDSASEVTLVQEKGQNIKPLEVTSASQISETDVGKMINVKGQYYHGQLATNADSSFRMELGTAQLSVYSMTVLGAKQAEFAEAVNDASYLSKLSFGSVITYRDGVTLDLLQNSKISVTAGPAFDPEASIANARNMLVYQSLENVLASFSLMDFIGGFDIVYTVAQFDASVTYPKDFLSISSDNTTAIVETPIIGVDGFDEGVQYILTASLRYNNQEYSTKQFPVRILATPVLMSFEEYKAAPVGATINVNVIVSFREKNDPQYNNFSAFFVFVDEDNNSLGGMYAYRIPGASDASVQVGSMVNIVGTKGAEYHGMPQVGAGAVISLVTANVGLPASLAMDQVGFALTDKNSLGVPASVSNVTLTKFNSMGSSGVTGCVVTLANGIKINVMIYPAGTDAARINRKIDTAGGQTISASGVIGWFDGLSLVLTNADMITVS